MLSARAGARWSHDCGVRRCALTALGQDRHLRVSQGKRHADPRRNLMGAAVPTGRRGRDRWLSFTDRAGVHEHLGRGRRVRRLVLGSVDRGIPSPREVARPHRGRPHVGAFGDRQPKARYRPCKSTAERTWWRKWRIRCSSFTRSRRVQRPTWPAASPPETSELTGSARPEARQGRAYAPINSHCCRPLRYKARLGRAPRTPTSPPAIAGVGHRCAQPNLPISSVLSGSAVCPNCSAASRA